MKKIYKGLVLFIMIVMFALPNSIYGSEVNEEELNYGELLNEAMNLVKEHYIDGNELTEKELFEAAMNGMFSKLDRYSSFMTPSELSTFENAINQDYVGIGVQLLEKGDYISITRVFDGSPAQEGGVLKGDYFVSVNDVSVKGLTSEEVVEKVIGEEGTKVKIVFGRGNENYTLELTRRRLEIPSVSYLPISEVYEDLGEMEKEKMAYIQISSFSSNADKEFERALERAEKDGVEYIILDLRDNGGGYVSSGVNIAREIVPEGMIVSFQDASGNVSTYKSKLEDAPFEIIALINENSASATEFVAAAIKESGAGVLVGQTTYGKGVAQSIFSFEEEYTIKLSMNEFFSRDNKKINGLGVSPNYEVKIPSLMPIVQRYYLKDRGEAILYLEEILDFLGYEVGNVDENFDRETLNGIKKFQKDQGLYSYGICDFTTQERLNSALIQSIEEKDPQLDKAISLVLEKVQN